MFVKGLSSSIGASMLRIRQAWRMLIAARVIQGCRRLGPPTALIVLTTTFKKARA